ncbi:hypothetical protein RclHR1_16400006 [Rhizophagus clarus]|uniref:Uncharacterized protein n=1 Tax=Rhizophagus clarus TaxID=94130 RepID=A0A2Z6QWN4_9GLOM|nr:hypothetical protein RclHR1_16400006 [Rhizophagus clarus]
MNIAGISQPFFDWGDNIPDFLAKLRLYMQNQGVDPADNAESLLTGREVAIGYLRGLTVNRRTALQIGADGLNETVGQSGTAIVKLRAVEKP